jgi:hypothetical protein
MEMITSKNMINKIIRLFSDYYYMRKLFKKLPSKKKIHKKIVFNTIKVDPTTFAYEVFMAAILSKEGATTFNIIDDGVFEHTDQIQFFQTNSDFRNIKQNSSFKNKVVFYLLVSLSKFAYGKHINFIKTSNIKFDNVKQEFKEFDSIVESSARRFFKTPFLNRNDKLIDKYYKLSYSVCSRSKQIGGFILNDLKADKLITSHGIYSTWGPCFNYVKSKSNIDVQIYGQLGHKKEEMLISDERLQLLGGTKKLLDFIEKGLNEDQSKIISNYFDKRISLKTEDAKVYYKVINEEVSFKSIGKVYAAFPNVITEADISERHIIFDNTIDWLIDTIAIFKKNKSNTLVIRCHPAESTMNNSKLSVEKELYRLCPELDNYPNIKLISSSRKINTYDMIRNKIDVGIIYEGVLGLEIAMLEKPVILCGKGRLSNNGFGLEPKDKKDYERLLKNPNHILINWNKKQMKELAMTIGYWNFYESGFYIPTIAGYYEPGFQFYKSKKYKNIIYKDISSKLNPLFNRTVKELLNS